MGVETASTYSGQTTDYAPVKKLAAESSGSEPYSSPSRGTAAPANQGCRQDSFRDVLDSIGELTGYSFRDPSLLRQAITHKSVGDHLSNQKMEWLGDSLLQLAVSDILYNKFGSRPDVSEGDLSLARTAFVKGETLRKIATDWNLSQWLVTAKGVSQVFVDKMQEDMVESILGAIFLDSDYETAREVVRNLFSASAWGDSLCTVLDHKSALQTFLGRLQLGITPAYEVVSKTGPDNNATFTMRVLVDQLSAEASGTSKLKAEQLAAKLMLEILGGSGATPISPTAKSDLLELCHRMKLQMPMYETLSHQGPFHSDRCADSERCDCPVQVYFRSECKVLRDGQIYSTVGRSTNKKSAEKIASHLMSLSLSQGTARTTDQSGVCEQTVVAAPSTHPKSLLLEWSLREKHAPPVFEIVEQVQPSFVMRCSYPALGIVCQRSAANKKAAEKLVADEVLMEVIKSGNDRVISD